MFTSENCFQPVRIGPAMCLALIPALLLAFDTRPGRGAINNANFNVYVSRDGTHLPSYSGAPSSGNQFGFITTFQEDKPVLELKNQATSDAGAGIMEFRMTIGDELFHFGKCGFDYAMIVTSPTGLGITSNVANNENELVISFDGAGLLPGQFVHFKIDIDRDDMASKGAWSYMTVLFDQGGFQQYDNGPNVMSNDDNSRVTVKYAMPGMDPLLVGPFVFEDTTSSIPYVNGVFAAYSQSSVLNPTLMFELGPPVGPQDPVIPEPSSLLLVVVATIGMSVYCSSRRRRRLAYAPNVVAGTYSR